MGVKDPGSQGHLGILNSTYSIVPTVDKIE